MSPEVFLSSFVVRKITELMRYPVSLKNVTSNSITVVLLPMPRKKFTKTSCDTILSISL